MNKEWPILQSFFKDISISSVWQLNLAISVQILHKFQNMKLQLDLEN